MNIQNITKYIAKDGKVFKYKEQCIKHDEYLEFLKAIFYKLIEDSYFKNIEYSSVLFDTKSLRFKGLSQYSWSYRYHGAVVNSFDSIYICIEYNKKTNKVILILKSANSTFFEAICVLDLFEIFL